MKSIQKRNSTNGSELKKGLYNPLKTLHSPLVAASFRLPHTHTRRSRVRCKIVVKLCNILVRTEFRTLRAHFSSFGRANRARARNVAPVRASKVSSSPWPQSKVQHQACFCVCVCVAVLFGRTAASPLPTLTMSCHSGGPHTPLL